MAKKYPAGNLATLKIESLQQNGKIIERMFFYDDDDGSESYVSFLSVFKNNPNWQIDEYFNYTKISSTNGIPISIFANKPSFEESGDQAIKKIFSDNQWEPSILIHRGHSFHTQKSLENLPDKTKLLFVGSCGGFYKATSALKNATDAQIIATKQIGTKLTKEGAMAKYYASEVAVKVSTDAVQIFGGYGYTKDFPVEKFYRDCKLCTIGEGTSEIQKLVISRNILKD
jgi:hypothetical protein